MNDIEQRITAALRAEAMTVTEESLHPTELPGRPRHRRVVPALVAAAVVVAAIVGAVAIASSPQGESPPAQTTSAPPPATSTAPAPTVGTPPPGDPTASTAAPPVQPVQPEPVCGTQKCHLVQSVRIGADTLELLAAPSRDHPGNEADWIVRVRGGAVLPGAPKFSSWVTKDSLHCATVAGKSVCLLDTYYLGDSDTSLGIVRDASGWHFTGRSFGTPFGAHRVDVRDLGRNGSLEVVSVEERLFDDGKSLWSASVWRWDGTKLGCVPQVATKEELPGWPEVRPDLSTVDPKNCLWP